MPLKTKITVFILVLITFSLPLRALFNIQSSFFVLFLIASLLIPLLFCLKISLNRNLLLISALSFLSFFSMGLHGLLVYSFDQLVPVIAFALFPLTLFLAINSSFLSQTQLIISVTLWAKITFFIDTVFIYAEIFLRHVFNIPDLIVKGVYLKLANLIPGQFQHFVFTSETSIYDQLPTVMTLRGFPTYTAPIYCIALLICVATYHKNKEKKQFYVALFFSLPCFIVMGVKTYIICGLIILTSLFIQRVANFKFSRYQLIFYSAISISLCLFFAFTDVGSSLILKWIDQLLTVQKTNVFTDIGPSYATYESSRINMIIDFNSFSNILEQLFNQNFLLGAVGDHRLDLIAQFSHEVMFLIYLYRYGILSVVPLFIVYFIIAAKPAKSFNTIPLYMPILLAFLVFADYVHHGRFLDLTSSSIPLALVTAMVVRSLKPPRTIERGSK